MSWPSTGANDTSSGKIWLFNCSLPDVIKVVLLYSDKDIDCDIRENIINYEDEGGGENDQTGYDLSVLRMMSDGVTPGLHAGGKIQMKFSPHDAPDIQTFLQTNKVLLHSSSFYAYVWKIASKPMHSVFFCLFLVHGKI